MPLQKDEIHGFYKLDGVEPKIPCIVAIVEDGYPAAQAGIKPKDIIRTVNGQTIWDFDHFIAILQKNGEKPLTIGITRGNEDLVKEVTPQVDTARKRVRVGISFSTGYLTPWDQLKDDALMVERILRGLIKPKTPEERKTVVNQVGGPFEILNILQKAVQSGWMVVAGFLRMICINLAILNLLPIPVLDGGHIMFAFYEVVTRRKPHPRVVAALVNFFAILLIALMIILVYRDIGRKVKTVKRTAELQQTQQEQK